MAGLLLCVRSLHCSSMNGISQKLRLSHWGNQDANIFASRKRASKICDRSHAIQRLSVQTSRDGLKWCRASGESAPDSAPLPADSGARRELEPSPQPLWSVWRANAASLREKVSKWGLAAVLAYGLFDGITYTTFFVLAFLGYEKRTGQNPAANLKALLGVVLLMWGGNNVTRPFRVAGAAAVAPAIDKGLKKIQEALKLPNQGYAFMICAASFATLCFSVVGILILSRLRG